MPVIPGTRAVCRDVNKQCMIAGGGGEDRDYDVDAPSEEDGEEQQKSSGSKRGPAGAAGARHTQRRRLSASIVDALLEPDSEVCMCQIPGVNKHILLTACRCTFYAVLQRCTADRRLLLSCTPDVEPHSVNWWAGDLAACNYY